MLRPVPGSAAGARQLGGWISREGKFYAASPYEHLSIAARLRAMGDGPAEPWHPHRDPWINVKSHGEVIALPGRVSQAQLDTLGDMLLSAPHSHYRSHLLDSLRTLTMLELAQG